MLQIGHFLEKFRSILSSDTAIKEAVVSSVVEFLGTTIPQESVSVRSGTVTIQAAPVVKNTLFMKKDALIKAVNKKLRGAYTVRDIR